MEPRHSEAQQGCKKRHGLAEGAIQPSQANQIQIGIAFVLYWLPHEVVTWLGRFFMDRVVHSVQCLVVEFEAMLFAAVLLD